MRAAFGWVLMGVIASRAAIAGDGLIPAGSINAVFSNPPIAVVHEPHPIVERHARGVRDAFFAGGELIPADEAVERDLSGFNVIVYGTPGGNAWIAEHAEALPFAFGAGEVRVQDKRFEGAQLRAICAVKNPQNHERRAVVYVAARPQDIAGINNLHHGPTEWLVADGGRTLAAGDYVITGPLGVEAQRADLNFVIERIEAVHPATVQGVPDSVQAAIDEAERAVRKPLSREQFWLVLNRLLLSLDDAHTSLGRQRSGRGVNLPLRWLREGLVVSADTDQLERGDHLIALGGRSEEALLTALRDIVPAENDGWIRHTAETALTEVEVLTALGLVDDDELQVTLERDGKRVGHKLPVSSPPDAEPRPPWVRYSIDTDASLGVFTLDSSRWDDVYRARLREFFEAVHEADVERIAVDVRRNSGGNSMVVDAFITYLDVDTYQGYTGAVRTSDDSVAQRGLEGRERGYVEYGPTSKKNRRVEDLPPFDGEIFILTSPATFSSGSWFAVIFQDNGLGTIVGEPTGNAPSSFGDILTFSLPASGFSFSMSYKRWLRPDRERDPATTLEPDVLVPLTREHLVLGIDPVLERLRGLARRGR